MAQGSLISFITAWYNVPFTAMLALCLLAAVAQIIGLGGEALSQNADVDADADGDADGDGDADHDADHGGDHDADGASALNLLAYLGVGKAPVAVILSMLLGGVGIAGWLLNLLVANSLGAYPALAIVPVLAAALIAGGFFTSRGARLIGRALPPISTTAVRAQGLVGRTGTVTSPAVDAKYGLVRLRDDGGTLLNVFAVATLEEDLRRGDTVVLLSYDELNKRYRVARAGSSPR